MAFLKIFKPKWNHSDPLVRLEAVIEIPSEQTDILFEIAVEESDPQVLEAVLQKITTLSFLEELPRNRPNEDPQCGAIVQKRLLDCYRQLLLGEGDLDHKTSLIQYISDSDILTDCAINAPETKIRLQAIEALADQNLLLQVIQHNCGKVAGLSALEKIDDISLLEKAAELANSRTVRAQANEKLLALRGPDEEQMRAQHKQAVDSLILEAEKLSKLADPEAALQRFRPLNSQWEELQVEDQNDLQQYQKFQKIIDERYYTFQRHAHQTQEKKARFTEQLEGLIEIVSHASELFDQHKDTFPEELDNISHSWTHIVQEVDEPNQLPCDLITDYHCLRKALHKKAKVIGHERVQLAEIEKEIADKKEKIEAGQLDDFGPFFTEMNNRLNSDQFQFLSFHTLLEKLTLLHQQYHDLCKQKEQEHQQELQANLEKRHKLIQDLTALSSGPFDSEIDTRFQEIKDAWKNKAPLPDGSFDDLDQKFQEAVVQYAANKTAFFKEKDWQLWANKTRKDEIISAMKKLRNVDDLHLVYKEMRHLQEQWKSIGDVPLKEENRLWKNYSNVSQATFKRCQAFFEELDEVSIQNRAQKEQLVLEAQKLQNSEQWRKTTDAYKSLQHEWKNIGRLKKNDEEDLYTLFRKACDHFFSRRTSHYEALDKERLVHLEEKVKLCQHIEEMVAEPLFGYAKKIPAIQKKWKEIGRVPKDKEDEVWQRFRGACDRYYTWLEGTKPDNLTAKKTLCDNARSLSNTLKDDCSNVEMIARELMALQKEWAKIGPAPRAEEKKVWEEFRAICDAFFAQRKKHYADLDIQRQENESVKKEYLKKLQKLIASKDSKSVRRIIDLQGKWKELGPATKKNDSFLTKKFQSECDDFFKTRREYFDELDRLRRENLKVKERLCLRLELLADIKQEKNPRPKKGQSSLSLAEQLKVAFESNAMAPSDSKANSRQKKEEVHQIEQEWARQTGQLPQEHEHALNRRFSKALKACKKRLWEKKG